MTLDCCKLGNTVYKSGTRVLTSEVHTSYCLVLNLDYGKFKC
jgi:hypothetical protein